MRGRTLIGQFGSESCDQYLKQEQGQTNDDNPVLIRDIFLLGLFGLCLVLASERRHDPSSFEAWPSRRVLDQILVTCHSDRRVRLTGSTELEVSRVTQQNPDDDVLIDYFAHK